MSTDSHEICGRCGKNFDYRNNLGRLKCRQTYYILGKGFSISADHMSIDCSDISMNNRYKLSEREMRDSWPEWIWTENDYTEMPKIKLKHFPEIDPRCIDNDHFEDSEDDDEDFLDTDHLRCISVADELINKKHKNCNLSPLDVYNIKNNFQTGTSTNQYFDDDDDDSDDLYLDYDIYDDHVISASSKYSSNSLAIDTVRIYRMDLRRHRELVYKTIPELLERRKDQVFMKNNREKLEFYELPGIKKNFHVYLGRYHGLHPNTFNSDEFKNSYCVQKNKREILDIKKKKQRIK